MAKSTKTNIRADNFWKEMALTFGEKFGLAGGLIFILLIFFFICGTSDQHKLFIDDFFLLKIFDGKQSIVAYIFILVLIVFTFYATYEYKIVKKLKNRIEELEKDKKDLIKLISK